jgi:uridine kinase
MKSRPRSRSDLSTLIAIAGGSGSGKTWLARRLKRRFGRLAGLLSLDDFYRDLSALSPRQRDRVNFDDPQAIDWALFTECLAGIQRGETVLLPRYNFSTHTRKPLRRRWKPRPIVLLEGLWLLRHPELRHLYSLSVFIDCPEAARRQRRLERDGRERGRSRASVLRQFREQVAPQHQRFVAPQARHAHLVLPSPISRDALASLENRIRQFLG